MRAGLTSVAAIALAASLAACSSEDSEPEASAEPAPQETTVEATTPAPAPTTEAPEQDATKDVEAALDDYVALEQQQLDAAGDTLSDVYSEVSVSAEYPNTVVFEYTYADDLDPDAATEYLEGMAPELEELCETAVFPAMEASGVTPDQRVTYTYYNADGSPLWTHTFES